MARLDPGSQSSATRTARVLDAAAADLEQAAKSLRHSASQYRTGAWSQAHGHAVGGRALTMLVARVLHGLKA